jgi:hypothetical protein
VRLSALLCLFLILEFHALGLICRSWASCFISIIIKPIVNPGIDINKINIKIEINSSLLYLLYNSAKVCLAPYRLIVPYVYSYLKQYSQQQV